MPFTPSTHDVVRSTYGASDSTSASPGSSSSYLEAASQYAPILKTLLFDEDPRVEYEKKSKDLADYITQYKTMGAGFSKNAVAAKIRDLQAEVRGLASQAESLSTSETLGIAGKATGVGLLVMGVGAVALMGYLLYEKAATERARRHQILSGRAGA